MPGRQGGRGEVTHGSTAHPCQGSGGGAFLAALRQKALPFLLGPAASRDTASRDTASRDTASRDATRDATRDASGGATPQDAAACWEAPPGLLLVCAGYDALESDPLATMSLRPEDFAAAVRMIVDEWGYPAERVALGLEGGYDLDSESGMPAGLVATCRALVDR